MSSSGMRGLASVAVLGLGLGSLTPAIASAAAPSIDEFAALSDYRGASLSPDGKRIAYTGRAGDKRALIVLDLEKRTNVPILAAEEDSFHIRWCRFKSSTRILCGLIGVAHVRSFAYNVTRLIAIDADGGRYKVLIQRGRNSASQFQDSIVDWRDADPRRVYIQLSPEESNSPFPDVYALDVESGEKSLVLKQRYPITDWYADASGVVRYGGGCDKHKRCEYVARASADVPWQMLSRWEAYKEDDFSVLGFAPDGHKLLVTETLDGRLAVYQHDLSGKLDKELVFAHPHVDVGGAVRWPVGGRVTGFWYTTDRSRRELFDAEAASKFAIVDKSLPGTLNAIVSTARDDKLLLVAAETDVVPTSYYLVDLEKNGLTRLGLLKPWQSQPLGTMKPVEIKMKDGVSIPGYLTVPPGAEPSRLPLVMYPHGGPHSRDEWGFDPVVQLMASRGYAVLQVNFRGSTGYGRSWYEAGLRKWGSVMIDDINTSVRWAIEQGIADPKRVCIVGWSFGGYAALMAAIREPQLYRCVGSIAGVADLKSLHRDMWRFYGGAEAANAIIGTEAEELETGSPLRSTSRMRAPVLLVHGETDIVVDVDQSRRMARALRSADRLDELVIIEDGDHSLSRSAWRKTLYQKLDGFLARHLSVQ